MCNAVNVIVNVNAINVIVNVNVNAVNVTALLFLERCCTPLCKRRQEPRPASDCERAMDSALPHSRPGQRNGGGPWGPRGRPGEGV
jgi:hypothetical protein